MYRREGAKCLRRKAAFLGDADKCFCRRNTCVRPKEKLQRRGDMFLCDGVSLHCRENKTHPSSAELHQPVEFHSLAKERWLRPSMKCRAATLAGSRRGSCEKIGIKRYSPPCITAASLQGGVAERFRKYREASAYREAGVVFR